MQNISIIIVDDHDIFRDGLKSLISLKKIANITGEASNGKEFLELLQNNKPDLVIMDISMPLMDGVTATEKALDIYPDLNVLALSMFGDEEYYLKMINAGAKGFVLKSSGKDEIIKAIHAVAEGNSYFSNELLHSLLVKFSHKKDLQQKNHIQFTKRELEIIELMCNGLAAAEIADKLCLSKKTVEGHRTSLFAKTGTKNSIALVVYLIKNHLVEI